MVLCFAFAGIVTQENDIYSVKRLALRALNDENGIFCFDLYASLFGNLMYARIFP